MITTTLFIAGALVGLGALLCWLSLGAVGDAYGGLVGGVVMLVGIAMILAGLFTFGIAGGMSVCHYWGPRR